MSLPHFYQVGLRFKLSEYSGFIIVNNNPDPWHFETDPWFPRTLDYGSGSGSGSCPFRQWVSSLSIFFVCYRSNKTYKSHWTVEIKVFPTFFLLVNERIRIRTVLIIMVPDLGGPESYRSGSWSPRNLRIRIRNTDSKAPPFYLPWFICRLTPITGSWWRVSPRIRSSTAPSCELSPNPEFPSRWWRASSSTFWFPRLNRFKISVFDEKKPVKGHSSSRKTQRIENILDCRRLNHCNQSWLVFHALFLLVNLDIKSNLTIKKSTDYLMLPGSYGTIPSYYHLLTSRKYVGTCTYLVPTLSLPLRGHYLFYTLPRQSTTSF